MLLRRLDRRSGDLVLILIMVSLMRSFRLPVLPLVMTLTSYLSAQYPDTFLATRPKRPSQRSRKASFTPSIHCHPKESHIQEHAAASIRRTGQNF